MGTRTTGPVVVDGTPSSGTPSSGTPSSGGPADPDRAADDPGTPTPEAADGTTIPSTLAGRTWIRVLPALVLLAVTLVFVLQNLRSAKVSFITASGRLPLGVALLVAAALGALTVLALGSIRIIQLRRLVHRSTASGDHRSRFGHR